MMMFKKFSVYISENPILIFLKLLLIFFAFILFFNRTWVGEDAFIFFTYVDNLIEGNGLVFNVGERVEGFTSPLWVFILAFFRLVLGWELRQLAMVLGIFFGLSLIVILICKDSKLKIFFPFGVLILITNSAFRDFITSGFETSLTLFLLTLMALAIKYFWYKRFPIRIGLLAGLLVLARPEAFLIFAFLALLFIYDLFKYKNISQVKIFLKFIFFPVILIGGYQLFRMGYYVAMLPNTFYAKRGGDLYLIQGLNYLSDFFISYPLTIVMLVFVVVLLLLNKKFEWVLDEVFVGRVHLLFLSTVLALYVLYSGGDFMHGRSLLMAFVLFVIAVNNFPELLINNFWIDDIETKWFYTIVLSFFVLTAGIAQQSYTAREKKQINYINDERVHFGFGNVAVDDWKEYLSLPITGQFGWAQRGYYYKDVAESTDEDLLIYMPNIGFFGYASGERVGVFGTSLIDPYQARMSLEARGKIGHEDALRWDYFLYRRPTFAYTPFIQWNSSAQFRLEKSEFSAWIKDDTDASFIPVFDLSNTAFIEKYSEVIGVDIKKSIDTAQRNYLLSLTNSDVSDKTLELEEYFGFLRYYWLPYASEEEVALYWSKRAELFGKADIISSYEKFEVEEKGDVYMLFEKITTSLSFREFMNNIVSVINSLHDVKS